MGKLYFTLLGLVLAVITYAQTDFYKRLSDAALSLTQQKVIYDPAYFAITYPNGDVPADRGVCTDVVIRAYRKVGIDLQKEVHEDMQQSRSVYPKKWGLAKADKNIDHRRVPNLMKFFSRKGTEMPITQLSDDYQPGHIVCWNLGGAITHIGLVVNRKSADGKRNLIVHNIGGGQVLADCLFSYKLIGHYTFKNKLLGLCGSKRADQDKAVCAGHHKLPMSLRNLF